MSDPDDDQGYRCDVCLRLLTREQMKRSIGLCSHCENAASEPPDYYYEDER